MKYKIAIRNLIVSQLIITIFLSFAYFNWFPHSLNKIVDFDKSALVLISVNLVLGPFLILLFYKKDKKNLRIDLFLLASFQVIALLFGMFSIYQKHPVYAVFAVDRFTLINASFAEPEKTIHKELKTTFLSKSKMAFARLPTDSKLRKEITMGHMLKGEPDIDGRAEFYEPYLNHTDKVISQSLNIKGMVKKTDEKNEIERFLNQYGGDIDTYAYIPLQTNKEDVIWVLNKLTAEPIGILKIDPWQFSKSQESKKKEKNKTRRWLS